MKIFCKTNENEGGRKIQFFWSIILLSFFLLCCHFAVIGTGKGTNWKEFEDVELAFINGGKMKFENRERDINFTMFNASSAQTVSKIII